MRWAAPYNLALGALAEAVLTLWLLLFGVNAQKWIEQSRLHTQPANCSLRGSIRKGGLS
jgi:hypothetical protein